MTKRLNISRRRRIALVCFGMMWLAGAIARAQSVNETVDNWLVEHGLPQHTVNAIAQTSDGFLWIGTEGGLARFDGFRFKTYDRNNTPAMSTNRIRTLASDSKNRLYVGMLDGDVGYMENHKFYSLNRLFRLESLSVTSIVVDGRDHAWISSYENLIRRYDGNTMSFIPLPEMENQAVIHLILDNNREPYAVHTKAFYHLMADSAVALIDMPDDEELRSGVYDWGTQAFWLLTTKRLLKYDGDFEDVGIDPAVLSGSRLRLIADIQGRLILTVNDVNYAFDTVKQQIVDDTSHIYSGEVRGLRSAYVDVNGNRWFGTSTTGLIRVRPNAFSMVDGGSANTYENAIAVYKDRSDAVWMSYHNRCIAKVVANRDISSHCLPPELNGLIYSIFESADGDVYLGSFDKGIYRYEDGEFILIPYPDLKYRWGYGFFEDRDGQIWVLTRDGVFHLKDGQLLRVQSTLDELTEAKVSFMAQLKSGALVISTQTGLYRFQNGVWDVLFADPDLVDGYYRGIVELDEDRILVGTYGNGMLVVNLTDRSAVRLTTNTGLLDNVVSHIHLDPNGFLWMSGNNGLSMLSVSELDRFLDRHQTRVHPALFNKKDGSPTNELHGGYQNSALLISDTEVIYPSINGFVHVDLTVLMPNLGAVPVAMVDQLLYGESVLHPGSSIQLPYNDGRLELSFAAPQFAMNSEPIFRYMLQGFDETWNETGSVTQTVYPRLEPGTYTFLLQTGTRGGLWNPVVRELRIEVIPPFHKSVLFKFFLTVIGLGLLALVATVLIRMYNNQQRMRFKQVMEAQEGERRRIAADLHDSVGQSLSSVKMMLNYAQHKNAGPDTVKDMIIQSQAVIDSLADEIRTISNNLAPASLRKFGLETAIEEQIRKSQIDDRFNIHFIHMLRGGKMDENMQLAVFRIFQELLTNSIKHSNASEISVQLIEHDDDISFTIEDDGIGFNFQEALDSRKGNGLHNIVSRVSLLGGKLHFDSTPGSGTTVTIQIPTNGSAHE